jgi:hypothetical protein
LLWGKQNADDMELGGVERRPLTKQLTPAQIDFLENLLEQGVLKFGKFLTKSGRQSPFFTELRRAVCTGSALQKLSKGYCSLVKEFPSRVPISIRSGL